MLPLNVFERIGYSVPQRHGPIEAPQPINHATQPSMYSVPQRHGPIEAPHGSDGDASEPLVFRAPKARPH